MTNMNQCWMQRTLLAAAAAVWCAAGTAGANTVAYWQFEQGPIDTDVPASATGGDPLFNDTIPDSSGNGNHMRTWFIDSAPTYITSPTSTVPQTGAPNTLALEFVPNQDIYAAGKPINSHVFNEWTVEASVRLDTHDGWQVFVGKDGMPTGLNEPPFWLKHADSSDLFELQALDSTGATHLIPSTFVPDLGVWYNLAGTSDGSTMSFYIKGPADSDYVLQGTTPFSGSLVESTADWTVGRGAWAGGIADWMTGAVDEVRISDSALDPSSFLFIPEPSSALLLVLGLVGLGLRRRSAM